MLTRRGLLGGALAAGLCAAAPEAALAVVVRGNSEADADGALGVPGGGSGRSSLVIRGERLQPQLLVPGRGIVRVPERSLLTTQPGRSPRRNRTALNAPRGAPRPGMPPQGGLGDGPSGPPASIAGARVRRLSLYGVATGERLDQAYYASGRYNAAALRRISHFLRDWHVGATMSIDPRTIDILAALQSQVGNSRPLYILSGYRTPQTNAWLASTHSGVARNSLHMQGKAVDLYIPGVPTAQLRQMAMSLRAGGVGYYPDSGFVHVDCGPIRAWS